MMVEFKVIKDFDDFKINDIINGPEDKAEPLIKKGLIRLKEDGDEYGGDKEIEESEGYKAAAASKEITTEYVLSDAANKQAKGTEFEKAIGGFLDKRHLAEQFIKIQPIYYERKGQFWVWDKSRYCWEAKDETDILNLISKNSYANTISSKEKSEILEALKQVGRDNKPEDIKPSWVQYRNKIYDIATNESFVASSKYFVSNPIARVVGDSEDTPYIDKLIRSWVAEEDVPLIYEILAFVTVPKYFIHAFFFLFSEPGKGKSTFVNFIIKILGSENCAATSIDRINHNPRFEAINWHKKLLITLSEVSNVNDLRNSGLINQATGEDPIKGEIKGGGTFDFVNYGKFIYPTNKLLKVSSDDGFGRRTRVVKFINRFEKEKDVLNNITEKELENLAKKSLRIAHELWISRKFTGDTSISERMKNYQEISKTKLEQFINKECDLSNFEAKISFSEFYSKYIKGLTDIPSKIDVSKELRKKLGYDIKKENYTDDNGNWKMDSKISGIKWRETQIML